MSGRLWALSLLLQAVGWGQAYYSSPRFRVIPKSDGSAVGEAQFYGLFGSNYVALTAPNVVGATIKWRLPSTDAAGALCSDGSKNLYFGCAGTSGITILNGLTASTQAFGYGSSGTLPNWTTLGGNTHILNLPFASTAGVSAGLISNTNFNTFNGKQDAISASGPITFVSNVVACPTCVAGYTVASTATPGTLALRDGSGGLAGVAGVFQTGSFVPITGITALAVRRGSSGQTDPLQTWSDQTGTLLSSIDKDGHFTGRSATATALAANGANCSAGQAPLGVDASGAVEGCFTPAGGGNVTGSGTTVIGEVPAYTNTTATGIGPGYAVSAAAVGDAIARRNGSGDIAFNIIYANTRVEAETASVSPSSDAVAANFYNGSASPTLDIVRFLDFGGSTTLSAINKDGNFTGRAATASALAANGSNCSAGQAAAGVDAAGAAEGCFTPAGGGNVNGPGSSTNLYYSQWSGTAGTSLGFGKAGASTTATASTVVERDTNGASKTWDKGAQFHNVMAYGATGNGSTDDRSAIQSAIDAETYGGVVYLPPGDFVLNSTHPSYSGCGLVIGNGTTSAYSSQNAITIQGSGGGVGEDFSIGNSTRGATRIKSGTSSITKLICLVGPVVKVWIRDVLLDGNGLTATGIEFLHVAESGIDRVNFRRFTTGWGMDFTVRAKTSGGWAFYSCGNKLTNFSMGEASSTSFSGIRLSGVYDSDAGPYHTSCSNVFERFGVSFGTGSGAVGAELAYADNNKFINGGFSSYSGGGTGSGKPVNFTKQSDGASGANFPYGNKFISIDSNHSQIYYGTNGDRGNFVLAHTEAEGNADPNLARLFWSTDWGRIELNANSTSNKAIRGTDSNGTEIFSLMRGGPSTNGLEVSSFDEIEFLSGANSLYVMKSNGVLVPKKTMTAASLPSEDEGSMVFCSNCTKGTSPCAASGGDVGVWAVRISAVGGNGWTCTTR